MGVFLQQYLTWSTPLGNLPVILPANGWYAQTAGARLKGAPRQEQPQEGTAFGRERAIEPPVKIIANQTLPYRTQKAL